MSQQKQRIQLHRTIEEADRTVLEHLVHFTGLSKQKLKHALNCGAVWITKGNKIQRIRRAKSILKIGNQLHLYYDEQQLSKTPPSCTLIADEGAYSVWFKPHYLLSQGSEWGDHCSLMRLAEKNIHPTRPIFLVHRLDFEASGLMLLAHSKSMASKLSTLFQQREVQKVYLATLHGRLELRTGTQVIRSPIDGKPAESALTVIGYNADKNYTHVQIVINTGRKHQIRKHCQQIGHPILGDRRYGNQDGVRCLRLYASSLSFVCPVEHTKKKYTLTDVLDRLTDVELYLPEPSKGSSMTHVEDDGSHSN